MSRAVERGAEQRVAFGPFALLGRAAVGADVPRSECGVGVAFVAFHGSVALLVAPRAHFVDLRRDFFEYHGLREIGFGAPVGFGTASVEAVGRFDEDPAGGFLGVEPQVEQVGQRFEQFRLADAVLGDVGEAQHRPVARARKEAGPQRAFLVEGQCHARLGAREVDGVEILGRCGRDEFRGCADPQFDGRLPRLLHVAVVKRPVFCVAGPLPVAHDPQNGVRRIPRYRARDPCRAARKGGPCRSGDAVEGAGQPVLAARGVAEDYDAVGVIGPHRRAAVFVAVGQREAQPRPRPQVHRVESPELRAARYPVVGGVLEVVLEPGAHLRRRGEADHSVRQAERAAVVAEFGNRFAVGVGRLGRGRVDDVAHRVDRCLGVGVDHPRRARRGGRRGQPPGEEPHPGRGGGGVARGVGAAHVERPEERRGEKGAFDPVARFLEHPLHEGGDVEKRVVVVDRQQPFGREQVLRVVELRVFVAVDGKELDGRVVGPASADRLGRKRVEVVDSQRVEHPPRRPFRPARSAVADFEGERFVRCRQQADRAFQQHGVFGRYRRRVQGGIEAAPRVRVARVAQQGAVARGGRNCELHPAAFAAGVRVDRPGGRIARYGAGSRPEVAGPTVYAELHRHLHGRSVLQGRISISSMFSTPWRWSTAVSVTTSTGS